MGAVGLRGKLVQAPVDGGFELAAKSDAMGVRTRSACRARGQRRRRGGRPACAAAPGRAVRLRLRGVRGPLHLDAGAGLRAVGGGARLPVQLAAFARGRRRLARPVAGGDAAGERERQRGGRGARAYRRAALRGAVPGIQRKVYERQTEAAAVLARKEEKSAERGREREPRTCRPQKSRGDAPGGPPSTRLRQTVPRLRRPQPRSSAGQGLPAHSLRGSREPGSSRRRRSGDEFAPAP